MAYAVEGGSYHPNRIAPTSDADDKQRDAEKIANEKLAAADREFHAINDLPGEFTAKEIPRLERLLKQYIEVRETHPKQTAVLKGMLALKIGYTHVNLGHCLRKTDNPKAIENYGKALMELKQVSAAFRDRMPAQERKNLEMLEAQLEKTIPKK